MPTIIYGLIDPRTQQLRYVGKTISSLAGRLRQHINDAVRGRVRIERFFWIRELVADGAQPEIVELELSGDDWREAEQFWIAYFRSLGADLVNATLGGDGIVGFRHSEETRRKQSASMSRYYSDPVNRAKSGEAVRRGYKDPDARRRLREALAPTWTAERRESNAQFIREMSNRPEVRAARSRTHKGKVVSSETRQKISRANLGRKRTLESIAKISAGLLGRKHKPETIEKIRQAGILRWAIRRA